MRLETVVKNLARESGFDLCGIARAEPVPGLAFFDRWLARGLDGPLAYLKKHRDARSDLNRVLAEVKSVICLARFYPSPLVGEGKGEGTRARIASYALGEDYHVSLKREMQGLAERLRRELLPDAGFRCVTDSAPVLERSLAEAAGLGWIGKNSCLIHPERGSFFLLGEILTTAELAPDAAPVEDQCGSCTACLDACPTGALVEPGLLDASRCVSTLTLEQKGELPEEHMPGMENWIAGCDVCQEVCPWNQAKNTPSPFQGEGRERVPTQEFPLAALLGLSLVDLRKLFKGSAVLRAKPAMLMRNALIAAGNSGDGSLRPLVDGWRTEPDPGIRQAARWASERLGSLYS